MLSAQADGLEVLLGDGNPVNGVPTAHKLLDFDADSDVSLVVLSANSPSKSSLSVVRKEELLELANLLARRAAPLDVVLPSSSKGRLRADIMLDRCL